MKTYTKGEKTFNVRALLQESFMELAECNDRFVLISPDISRSSFPKFIKEHSDRHMNLGIAEQNAVDVAAGMAMEGMLPYIYGMAPFISMRSCEQVRTSVCYQNCNVKLIGYSSGLTGNGGSTHYSLEDYGLMRSYPNMTIILPGDPCQIKKIITASLKKPGPMYIRIGGSFPEPAVYAEDYDYEIGRGIVVQEGKDATIIACGVMVAYAVDAADQLKKIGIHVTVIDMHTIKPIDKELVVQKARLTGCVLTVEDHTIFNGLGSAVAEILAEENVNCRFKRLGIPDIFPGFGEFDELIGYLGYDAKSISAQLKAML